MNTKEKKKKKINNKSDVTIFAGVNIKRDYFPFLFYFIFIFKMHDTSFSCCCSKIDCPQLQEFNECFKRTEYDALLAAGI